MDKISNSYRVKREGVDIWVPQFALSTSDLLWWNDFCDIDDNRIKFVSRQEATAFVELRQRESSNGSHNFNAESAVKAE